MSPLVFFALLTVLIAWFVLDRPSKPGEIVRAEVMQINPVPTLSGPPKSKLVARLEDGALVTLEIARNDALDSGDQIQLRRAKRRLSGIASYDYLEN